MHTDLVPILLGFRNVVQGGRKVVESTTIGNETTTRTTTFGYLTDSDFYFACNHVRGILKSHQNQKKHLTKLVAQLNRTVQIATRNLAKFRDYLGYLDAHRVRKMKQNDASRVVQFHAWDYTRDWEINITRVRSSLGEAEAFVQPLSHYTRSAVEHIEEHTRNLEWASKQLDQLIKGITRDVRTLQRYVPLLYRMRNSLWPRRAQALEEQEGRRQMGIGYRNWQRGVSLPTLADQSIEAPLDGGN